MSFKSDTTVLGMCFGGKPHETKEQLEGDVETQKNSGFFALSGSPSALAEASGAPATTACIE